MVPKVPAAEELSPGWQRKRAATRERILEAAFAILMADGSRGLTIPRLSNNLGYTVGALYRYFPSKDALIAAVQGRAVSRVAELLEHTGTEVAQALAGRRIDEPVAGLVPIMTFCEVYSRLPTLMPEVLTTITEALRTPQSLLGSEENDRVMVQLIPLLDRIGQWSAAAASAGAIRRGPKRERALVLWSTLHGAILVRNADLPSSWASTDGLAATAVRTTLMGWGAESARVARTQRLVNEALDGLEPKE